MLKCQQLLVFVIMLVCFFCTSVTFASNEVETLKQQGEVFFEKNDYDKAIECYKKIDKLEKNNAEVNNKIGLGYFKKQEYKTAIKYFDKAIKADTNFKEARENIKNAVTMGHMRWIDKEYNFSKVHSIFLVPMEKRKTYAENIFDTIVGKNIKCEIIKQNEKDEVKGDIYIKTDIKKWDTDKYHVSQEVYYEGWEERTRHVKDRNGKWVDKKERHWKTSKAPFWGSHQRTIPAHDVYHSNVNVLFEVYDSKSNNLIMIYDENLSEQGAYKQEDIYIRILNRFLGDLSKKIK